MKFKRFVATTLVLIMALGLVGISTTLAEGRVDGVNATIATGAHSSYMIDGNGVLWMWDNNAFDAEPTPMPIGDGVRMIGVAHGTDHTIALDENGNLWAWGNNARGQLGLGDTTNRHIPTFVMGDVVALSAGNGFSAAITTEYRLYMWGANGSGQLGVGDNVDRLEPTFVMHDVSAVSAGDSHALTIVNGEVLAWGNDSGGRLGDGTITNAVVAISAGHTQSAAIDSEGVLFLWGGGVLSPVFSAVGAVQVSLGAGQTMWVDVDDNLHTWGANPIDFIMDNAIAISAGVDHSLAVDAYGNLWAWSIWESATIIATGVMMSHDDATEDPPSTTEAPTTESTTPYEHHHNDTPENEGGGAIPVFVIYVAVALMVGLVAILIIKRKGKS